MTSIPREAVALHQQGREAGSAGDPVRAIELFDRARELAPDWAYPPYDMAFTYLLHDYLDQAERWYAVVDALEPRGFFTSKTSLDTVRRELAGELPQGFARAFAMLDWESPERQRIVLQEIVGQHPGFAPAWHKLAFITDDEDARLAMIERGLAARPDDETYSVLLSNKALMLDRRGQRAEARRMLRDLLADPRCTAGTEATTKALCAGLLSDDGPA
jgi:tetratricopeptide (TPR) repeat protein